MSRFFEIRVFWRSKNPPLNSFTQFGEKTWVSESEATYPGVRPRVGDADEFAHGKASSTNCLLFT